MTAVAADMTFPALRGRQGDREFFVLLPTNAHLLEHFTPDVEPHDQSAQRAVVQKHADGIRDYILENRGEFVLGALTYAIDEVASFEPVAPGSSIGELTLAAATPVRSIDGQHRRLGIAAALETSGDLAGDGIAVVLYVEDDLGKRRQMFSDMNWTPRKVSASQNVAFDSRDPFSRAVRRIVQIHPLLQARVESELATVRRGSAKFYTLGAVYDACRRLMLGPNGKIKSKSSCEEDEIVDRSQRFFDMLVAARPELISMESQEALDEFRKQSILVSSTTLRVLAGATYQCIDKHRKDGTAFQISDLTSPLSEVDFTPSAELWRTAGFVSEGKSTPNARAQEVALATNLLAGRLMGLRPDED